MEKFINEEEPCILVDRKEDADLDALKSSMDNLLAKEAQYQDYKVPLSWLFLRNAFYKTGEMYITKKELEKYAKKCRIKGEKLDDFLCYFTSAGSIIYIPDIPEFNEYVILNPMDFYHKLEEVYYPHFNGDLKYGIISKSTLRRMFGKDTPFFKVVLLRCIFATKLDRSRN